MRWFIVLFCAIAVAGSLLVGCGQGGGLKGGASSADEVLKLYRYAHLNKDVKKLRPVLLWHATTRGSWGGVKEAELAIQSIFDRFDLEKVIWVEVPPTIYGPTEVPLVYRTPRPDLPPKFQTDNVGGPNVGKIVIEGTVQTRGRQQRLRLDPCFGVLRSPDGRFFLYPAYEIVKPVMEAMLRGEQSKTVPYDPPGTKERVWWSRSTATTSTSP